MSAALPPAQPLAEINRLFVTALLTLAQAGRADEACRLAARGWSTLRRCDEREAERLSAALHSLARHPSVASFDDKGVAHG